MACNKGKGFAPPSVVAAWLGHPPPVQLPDGYADGPFRGVFTIDYDGAVAVTYDMTDHDFLVDLYFQNVFGSNDKPEVILQFDRIRLDFLDETAFEHTDPEDIMALWKLMYLEIDTGDRRRQYELVEACGFPLQINVTGSTDQQYWTRPSRWLQLPEPVRANLNTVKTLVIGHAAPSSIVGSGDIKVDVYLDGFAFRSAMAKNEIEYSLNMGIEGVQALAKQRLQAVNSPIRRAARLG